ncbi:MAG: serine kinase [Betaproteobacteria bacterium]
MDYWERIGDAFDDARRRVTVVESDFRIDGLPLRLRFAGQALAAALSPAFSHCIPDPGQAGARASLTIDLWDSASTGVPIPAPSWSRPEPALAGSLDYYHDRRLRLLFRHKNTLWMLDRDSGRGMYWCEDPQKISGSQMASPLRQILAWWALDEERVLCHAGAVGNCDGAVLLAGKSGSGKSTTALACHAAGMSFLGDDCVIVSDRPAPRVASVYNSAKLNGDNLERFPVWQGRVHNPQRTASEKALFFLHAWAPRSLARGLPLRAILLPRITGTAETRLKPATAVESLVALAPSSIRQTCGEGHATLESLARVHALVPTFVLELGTDLTRIAEVVAGVLARNA